jgi:2-iminobutanoate/2-iminopropanoate deaminase
MKQCITSDKLPQAIGPYSQIVVSSGFMFLSGQIPLDPATGNLVEGGIEKQTRTVLNAIKTALQERHLDMSDVVKVTAYLTGPGTFAAFNTVYAGYFTNDPPVRTTVFVSALPKGAQVELDVIAALGS